MEYRDEWLANDKYQHFLLRFIITIIVSFLASRTRCTLLRRHNTSIGCIVSLSIGTAKEVADELGFFKSAGASVKDVIADIIGVSVAIIVLYLWNSFVFRNRYSHLDHIPGVEIV